MGLVAQYVGEIVLARIAREIGERQAVRSRDPRSRPSDRLATRRYQALAAIRTSAAIIPLMIEPRAGRFAGAAGVGFALAGAPSCSE